MQDEVRAYYDQAVQEEWERLERHPIEFELNKRFLGRYIGPGQRVLDLGGGPGRYSLWLSGLGCDTTLADLSPHNVAFALERARERGLPLEGLTCDGRDLSIFADASFDHVLCMGPMYHLPEAADRNRVVEECLRVLRPGGTLSCAFISSYAGVLYYLKHMPQAIIDPNEGRSFGDFIHDRPFAGIGFTRNFFARFKDIRPFFENHPLTHLHLLGSESILSINEAGLLTQPPEVMAAWLDIAEQVCEREDLLSFAEHYLYIGRKQG